MSVPDFRLCDVCGKPTKIEPFCFWVDRCMDAAGSMEDEYDSFDLCETHCAGLLRSLTRSTGPKGRDIAPLAAELVKQMKQAKGGA